MLIGVIDTPLSKLKLDDQIVEPASTGTVVRLFLPVQRTAGSNTPMFADPNAEQNPEPNPEKLEPQ
jgi:hypothetical protein